MRRSGSGVERRLWRDGPGARRALFGAVALKFVAATCWIVFALLLSSVIGDVFVGGESLDAVDGALWLMAGLVLVRGGLLWGSEVVAQGAANDIKTRVRERLSAKLVALGPTYTRTQRAGELVYAAGEGVEELDAYVTRYVPARLLAVIVPASVAVVVMVLDPWSVPILLVAGPFLVLLLSLIGRRVRDLSERRERELAWLNAHFLDVLRGLSTLKMFGRSVEQAETIETVSRSHGDTSMDVLRTAFQTTLVLEWGATAATALVAIETSVRLMAGGLGFERALAVLILVPEFFLPLRQLSAEYHAGQTGAAVAARIYAILDEPARAPTQPVPTISTLPARFDVRFEDVQVSYGDGTRVALAGCTFEIGHGTSLALVGPTGAGKTTIANVLLRFVEPDRGRVSVAGTPLAEIDPIRWRTRVGFVPQHPSLFHGTIADNLRLAKRDASNAELIAATRAANAHGFISALPAGYETQVGEGGARLSGGERQRLALARAFLKDAPFLILDEPTSQLDDRTEEQVLEDLRRLMEGRTVLLISHRSRPVADVDRVEVIAAGRVAPARVWAGADRPIAAPAVSGGDP